MSQEMLLEITQQMFMTAALLAAPILTVAIIIGVIVGIVQAVTSIQEQTLVFIPKMFAVALTLFFAFPWMIKILKQLTFNFAKYMLNVAGY